MNSINSKPLSGIAIDRIIEMAWEDRTTFEAIEFQFGLKEQEVINLMRREMKPKSFKMWRKRVQGRKTKHQKLRTFASGRFKCTRQKSISNNSIAKR
ncbi:TIGR03643 family protein [Polaribacter sp.]|uniref:TIGR03643 family protein n=1 Tax=Polaribacter sp. TaxID=1920175 RepID=UPI003F6AA968